MTVFELPRKTEPEPHYSMVAIDGADDDGGTLYVLYDEHGRQITGSAWPQPLEAIAQLAGFPVKRTLSWPGVSSDCEVPRGRRAKVTIDSELLERTHRGPLPPVNDEFPDNDLSDEGEIEPASIAVLTCKWEGCDAPALTQLGMYGLLCAEHKEAKKQTLKERKSTLEPKAAEPSQPERPLVHVAREIDEQKQKVDREQEKLDELVRTFSELVS